MRVLYVRNLYRMQHIRLTEKRPEYTARFETVVLHYDTAVLHVEIPVKK